MSIKCSLQACPMVTSFAIVLLRAGFARSPKQCPCLVNTGRVSGYFSSTSYTFESFVICMITRLRKPVKPFLAECLSIEPYNRLSSRRPYKHPAPIGKYQFRPVYGNNLINTQTGKGRWRGLKSILQPTSLQMDIYPSCKDSPNLGIEVVKHISDALSLPGHLVAGRRAKPVCRRAARGDDSLLAKHEQGPRRQNTKTLFSCSVFGDPS